MQKQKYNTKKRRTKQFLAKAYIILGAIIIASGFIGYNHVQAVKAIDNLVEVPKIRPTMPLEEPKTLREVIYGILTEEGGLSFDEAMEAMAIAECESHFNQYAVNFQSKDFGVWQLNEKYQKANAEKWYLERYGVHRDFRDIAFDPYSATRFALKLYSEQGLNPWVCYK